MTIIEGVLLQSAWSDRGNGITLEFWLHSSEGPIRINVSNQKPLFFTRRDVFLPDSVSKDLPLKSLGNDKIRAHYFECQKDLETARKSLQLRGVRPMESDIQPNARYLMERFIRSGVRAEGKIVLQAGIKTMQNPKVAAFATEPAFRVCFFHLLKSSSQGSYDGIWTSINGVEKIFDFRSEFSSADTGLTPKARGNIVANFFGYFRHEDPDIIVAWDSSSALQNLSEVLHVSHESLIHSLSRSSALTSVSRLKKAIQGRVYLGCISTLKSATYGFERFEIEKVAEALGLQSDATDSAVGFAHCISQARLLGSIFFQTRLLEFLLERQRLTGLTFERTGGSVAAFDALYLPLLHRAGFVAPSVGDRPSSVRSPGGYVFESIPGLHKNVVVLDFKSLYPSLIRTFLVDPLGLAQAEKNAVPGFEGAKFNRSVHILPGLVKELWSARDRAKAKQNESLSRAIKIMMNSLYGVLGTPGCRFYDHRLVSSITERGHQVMRAAKGFIEDQGYTVIYGDTDSLFLLLEAQLNPQQCRERAHKLAGLLNEYFKNWLQAQWQLASYLEIQLDAFYSRFLMPTLRDSKLGSKKRYAGLSPSTEGASSLVIKGLEAVRSDWTRGAQIFQEHLLYAILKHQDFMPVIRTTLKQLYAGRLDHQLIYRKRVRRSLESYTKNTPPHIRAARKLGRPVDTIEYLWTVQGPQPLGMVSAPLDYSHYANKQFGPAAESVLSVLGFDWESCTSRQLILFNSQTQNGPT